MFKVVRWIFLVAYNDGTNYAPGKTTTAECIAELTQRPLLRNLYSDDVLRFGICPRKLEGMTIIQVL